MKTLALALFALIATCLAHAQVRDYGFAVEQGYPSYLIGGPASGGNNILFDVPIIDSMALHPDATRYVFLNNGGPSADSIVSGPGYPIGFGFRFDGEVRRFNECPKKGGKMPIL